MRSSTVVFSVLSLLSAAFAQDDVAAKVAKLRSATSMVDRIKMLDDNEVRPT